MKRYTRLHLVCVTGAVMALSLLLSACGLAAKPVAVPAGAKAGDLILSPCSVEVQGGKADGDCGTLIVPENRKDSSSRLIALPVVRVRAKTSSAAEPIFWLSGGPGQSNIAKPPAWMFEKHDVVFVGYRGVDGSVRLDCPEFAGAIREMSGSYFSEAGRRRLGDAVSTCAARLQTEGADLAGYTAAETVDDLEAARAALGYERIHLYSLSYGTRVAQIYAYLHPDRLFRSAMVGVNPPGHFVWEPDLIDSQLRYYAEICKADTACSARTDDLAESFRRVMRNMSERWLVFPIHPDKVKLSAFAMLMHRDTAAMAIDAVLAAEEGDSSGLAMLSAAADMLLPNLGVWGDLFLKGYSADFDPNRDYDTELNPPDSIMGSPMAQVLWNSRTTWPTPLMPEELRRVQPSDTETLLVSGSVDFSTPVENAAEELLPLLRNGTHIVLKEMGHTEDLANRQPQAFAHLITSFFDTGNADNSLFRYDPINFNVPFGFPAVAKTLLIVAAAVLVLAGIVVWLIIRRWIG